MNPVFAVFVAAVAFTQSSHAVFFALGSVHRTRLGLSEATIGGLWAGSVGAEVGFMVLLGSWAVRRLGPVRAIALSGAAGVLRWGAMSFDPAVWALWPLQALHAATFGLGHLGAMAFIAEAVRPSSVRLHRGAMGSMAVGLLLALGIGRRRRRSIRRSAAAPTASARFCRWSGSASLSRCRGAGGSGRCRVRHGWFTGRVC